MDGEPTSPSGGRLDGARRVALVGHFTPPIHGMAAAMDALAALLNTLGPVVRIRTVPKGHSGGCRYHITRTCLVLRAASRLASLRAKSDAVLLSVDAGKGMVYVIALTWVARRLRYRVALQHHSYAYISRRTMLAGLLVDVAGPHAEHLHSCQVACDDFRRVYPRALTNRAVSVAYALQLPPRRHQAPDPIATRTLRVGHLSNLTLEKGLERVIHLGRDAIQRGMVEKVILAGPVTGRAERRLMLRALSEPGFEYRGLVTGQPKENFFQDIDIFVFPTRYRNEFLRACCMGSNAARRAGHRIQSRMPDTGIGRIGQPCPRAGGRFHEGRHETNRALVSASR